MWLRQFAGDLPHGTGLHRGKPICLKLFSVDPCTLCREKASFAGAGLLFGKWLSLLSGKSQEKRHRNSHQNSTEDKPPRQRNPNDGKHNEAQRDEDAGELGIGLHHPERTRVPSRDAMLHENNCRAVSDENPLYYGSLKSTVTCVWKSVGSPLCQ